MNAVNNIILRSTGFDDESFRLEDFYWEFCNRLFIEYKGYNNFENQFRTSRPFDEYLVNLQTLLDILWEKEHLPQLGLLIDTIQNAIKNIPIKLGIRLKVTKQGAQLHLSGSPILDEKLVDDVLDILGEENLKPVKIAFEKGLKELLESKQDSSKLRNTIRDMQLACDEISKYVLNDKKAGLKILLKTENEKTTGLNEYQFQIFRQFNSFADKLVKHKADSFIDYADTENFVYLAGLLIRLVLQKNPNK